MTSFRKGTLVSGLFLTVLTLSSQQSYGMRIPEIANFLTEQIQSSGATLIANENALTRNDSWFRFEAFVLRIRALVGFDASSIVNITLVPEVELYWEREKD